MRIGLIGHSIDKEIKPLEADAFRKYCVDLLNVKAAALSLEAATAKLDKVTA